MSGVQPITLGQDYSTIAWIPEAQGRWALPLLHERMTSAETPIAKAASQLCQKLAVRPLSLWDAAYGCDPFLQKTAAIACDKLIRLAFQPRPLWCPSCFHWQRTTAKPWQVMQAPRLHDLVATGGGTDRRGSEMGNFALTDVAFASS